MRSLNFSLIQVVWQVVCNSCLGGSEAESWIPVQCVFLVRFPCTMSFYGWPKMPLDGWVGSTVFHSFFSLLRSLMSSMMEAVTGTYFVTKRCPVLYSQEVKVHTAALTLGKFPDWEGESAGDSKVNTESWRRAQTLERGCSFCWCYALPGAL